MPWSRKRREGKKQQKVVKMRRKWPLKKNKNGKDENGEKGPGLAISMAPSSSMVKDTVLTVNRDISLLKQNP